MREEVAIPPGAVLFPDAGSQFDDLDAEIVLRRHGRVMFVTLAHQLASLFVGVLQSHGMSKDDNAWFNTGTGRRVFLNDATVHTHSYAVIRPAAVDSALRRSGCPYVSS